MYTYPPSLNPLIGPLLGSIILGLVVSILYPPPDVLTPKPLATSSTSAAVSGLWNISFMLDFPVTGSTTGWDVNGTVVKLIPLPMPAATCAAVSAIIISIVAFNEIILARAWSTVITPCCNCWTIILPSSAANAVSCCICGSIA